MNVVDSIVKLGNTWLPRKHRLAAAGLFLFLLALILLPDSADNTDNPDNTGIADAADKTPVGQQNRSVIIVKTDAPSLPLPALPATPQAELPKGEADEASASEVRAVLASTAFELPPAPETLQAMTQLVPAPEPADNRTVIEVKSGDNLSLIFTRAGLTARDVYQVSRSSEHSGILTRLYPGYKLAFDISEDKVLNELEVVKTPLESFIFTRNESAAFDARHEIRTAESRQSFKEATIDDSLFLAAQRGGISAALTMELAGIFGGVIDFLLDTRVGDTFNVLYEERYLDGEFVGNGPILAAQFVNQGQTFTAIRYTNEAGETDYFNPQGESMRKAFLRNPVDFVRISSDFNPNRRHPILNTIRAHKGTDYAAPNGTPVVAAGDGRVTWASRNGSFGNLVVVQHNDRFETKYAHLSKYANGIRVGSRVRQGQVIGYVGATGGATGPHLHYEFLMDGVHRNPRTIHNQLPKAESIVAAEMPRFVQQSQVILAQLGDFTGNPTLAQNIYQDD